MSQDARRDHNPDINKEDWTFDKDGNMIDAQGSVMVPHQVVQQYIPSRQQQCSIHPAQFRGSLGIGAVRGANNRAHDQPASHHPSLAIHSTSNTYSAAEPAYSAIAEGLRANNWLPEDTAANFDSTIPVDSHSAWYQAATSASGQLGLPYEHSPQLLRGLLTPSIRLTSPDLAGAQPQHTNFSTSPMASLPPYSYNNYPEHDYGHLRSQPTYHMPEPDAAENMQTPVSPVSAHTPHDPSMADQQLSRKRSHSEMSQSDTIANAIQQDTQPQPHSRSGSVTSQPGASPNGVNEDFNPRGTRAFKRGDPPKNQQNQYICDFADECAGQTFDRKCEWSKHMDKHDRPYRCQHSSCAKLQGFTYSGGLLRHEREVHGKHGGPKAALMCPVEDCKRHSGKGFTRKENLNEHLRRVHPDKDPNLLSSQPMLLRRDGTDVTIGAEDGDTPALMGEIQEPVDHQNHYLTTTSPAIGTKRKRSLAPGIEVDLSQDHEPELKRLRRLVEEQAERIRFHEERIKLQDANAIHYENRIQELEGLTADQEEKILRMEAEFAEANMRNQLASANSAA